MAHTAVYAYIGWKDVFDEPPPPKGLEYYLSRLPREWAIETIAKIGATLFNSGLYYLNANQQIAFVRSFPGDVTFADRVVRIIESDHTRIIAHPSLVAALMKYVLIYSSPYLKPHRNIFEYLLRSIVIFNTRYGEIRRIEVDPHDRNNYLPYESDSILASDENFSFSMARYYCFMKWAKAQPPAIKPYLPVYADFKDFFGASFEEYTAAALAVVTPFVSRLPLDEWMQQTGCVDISDWTAKLTEKRFIDQFVESLSVDIAEVKSRLAERTDAYGLADLRPFIDRPLLRVRAMRFVAPYQGFLRNRLGTGLYFAIFDKYRSRCDDSHLRFSEFFGHFLEEYLLGLVSTAAKNRPDTRTFGEVRYRTSAGELKSSDIVFIAGGTAVFMDVTRSRLKLDQTVCELDPQSLVDDIKKIFVKKAHEIDRSIADFRRRAFRLGDVDPSTITKFIPVIITEQDLPQLIALPVKIRSAIQAAGHLTHWEDVQILSAEDVELLHLSGDGNLQLEGILARKAAMPNYTQRDLASYLYDNEPEMLRPTDDRSLPGYREFFEVATQTLRGWGLAAQ
jgi:hypothetical protein